MAVSQKRLHMLAHTARIFTALKQNEKYGNQEEYSASIANYSTEWKKMSTEEKVEAVEYCSALAGLTSEMVAKAAAALEE